MNHKCRLCRLEGPGYFYYGWDEYVCQDCYPEQERRTREWARGAAAQVLGILAAWEQPRQEVAP